MVIHIAGLLIGLQVCKRFYYTASSLLSTYCNLHVYKLFTSHWPFEIWL